MSHLFIEPAPAHCGSDLPVIVVTGLPRSGTSMVMRMLQAGGVPVTTDGERQADEDNPLGYFEVERVKRLAQEQDKSWLSQSRGKAIKVISHLLQSLPHDNYYKVILCERDLGEVLSSQNVMLQRREQPNPIDDDEARAHYERHLAHIRIFMKVKRNMEFLPVRYDEAIRDPRAFAQRLNSFLGGQLNVDRMVEVVDSRLYRNRKERARVAQASMALVALAAALGAGLLRRPGYSACLRRTRRGLRAGRLVPRAACRHRFEHPVDAAVADPLRAALAAAAQGAEPARALAASSCSASTASTRRSPSAGWPKAICRISRRSRSRARSRASARPIRRSRRWRGRRS